MEAVTVDNVARSCPCPAANATPVFCTANVAGVACVVIVVESNERGCTDGFGRDSRFSFFNGFEAEGEGGVPAAATAVLTGLVAAWLVVVTAEA